jgi:hypothetical protein
MSWIKRTICNWLGVERWDDSQWGEVESLKPINRNRSSGMQEMEPACFFEKNPRLSFRMYKASGGMIVEATKWNDINKNWDTTMHLIHDDEEHLTNSIAKIITMESLR